MTNFRNFLLATISGVTLAACGGGGGSGGGSGGSGSGGGSSNSPPRITSPTSFEFAENEVVLFTVQVADADGDTVSIAIDGTTGDGSHFVINASNGNVNANTADNMFDFENPLDQNGDNVYEQTITLSDGKTTVRETITVTITDFDEDPVCLETGVLEFDENFTGVLYNFENSAEDPEGAAITGFALTDLTRDSAFAPSQETLDKFSFNASTGELSLIEPLDAEEIGTDGEFRAEVQINFGPQSVNCRGLFQLRDVAGAVTSGVKFTGPNNNLTDIGDVDGDGITDFVLSLPADSTQSNGPEYLVVLGVEINALLARDGFADLDIDAINPSNTVRIIPGFPESNFLEFEKLGDFDGDNNDEVVVAFQPSNQSRFADNPLAIVLWDRAFAENLGGELNLFNLELSEGVYLYGERGENRSESNVGAGDFDGDGNLDVVVGAPNATVNGQRGQTYMVFNDTFALANGVLEMNLMTPQEGIRIADSANPYSRDVFSLSDVTGDGADELIATDGLGVSVVSSDAIITAKNGTGLISWLDDFAGVAEFYANTAVKISDRRGDANGNGVDDLLVSGGQDGFAALIYDGGITGNFGDRQFLYADRSSEFVIFTTTSGSFAESDDAHFVSDYDGDGASDIAILASSIEDVGAVYVIPSGSFGLAGADGVLELDTLGGADLLKIVNGSSPEFAGNLEILDDIDGDGLSEIAIAAAAGINEAYIIPSSDIQSALTSASLEFDIQTIINNEGQ